MFVDLLDNFMDLDENNCVQLSADTNKHPDPSSIYGFSNSGSLKGPLFTYSGQSHVK